MKKYMIGILIGFFLSLGVSAHAAVENLIGRTVEGIFPVKVNGAQIEKQAIVIDGTSYLPVRAMGDALGMDVSFNADLGIGLTQKVGVKMAAPDQKNVIKPTRFEKAITKVGESVVSSSAEIGLIEVDGNQYVSLSTIGAPYTILWEKPNAVFRSPDQPDVNITISDEYTPNIDGFRVEGSSYVKLSLLGLKAIATGATLEIDKQ